MPARTHRALGIVLVCVRIAEIGKYAVAQVSGDETAVFDDDLRATSMISVDDLPQILRIEPS